MGIELTPTTAVERIHIPASVYDAKLVNIREGEMPNFDDPSVMDKVLWWTFEITGKKGTVQLDGRTSRAFGPKSNAYRWATALMGEITGSINTDNLIGKGAKVLVADVMSRQGVKYSKVKDVMAAPAEDDDSLPF